MLILSVRGPFDFDIHGEFRRAYIEGPRPRQCLVDLAACTDFPSVAIAMIWILDDFFGEATQVHVTGLREDLLEHCALFREYVPFVFEE